MSRRSLGALLVVAVSVLAVSIAPAAAASVTSGPLTWQAQQFVDPVTGFTSVSCVTRNSCRAGDRSNRVERWDGQHWSHGTVLDESRTTLRAMDCASTEFCAAVQIIAGAKYRPVTRNRDGSWDETAPVIDPPALAFGPFAGSISCVDRSFCMLADGNGAYQVYSSGSWSPPIRYATASRFQNTWVQCSSATLCRLVEGLGAYFVWNGATWTSRGTVGTDGGPISCPMPSFCMLVRHNTWRSFDGRSWSAAHRLGTLVTQDLKDVDCTAPTFCLAIRFHGPAFAWNGVRWGESEPTGSALAQNLSCASKDFCVAVNDRGLAMHRVDGAWQPPREGDPELGGRTRIACGDTQHCLIVDENGGFFSYDGSSWTTPQRLLEVPAYSDLFVSCAGSFCVVAGPDGALRVRSKGVWSAPHVFPSTAVVTGVSCGSPTLCIVTAERSLAIWDGRTWSRRPEAGKDILRGACGPNGCVFIVFDREAQHRVTRIFRPGQPAEFVDSRVVTQRLSCPGLSFCMAVSRFGAPVMMFDGSAWTPAPTPTDLVPRSVSCASPTLCVAVGGQAESTWNGTEWSPPSEIVDQHAFLDDVSCRPGICAASGSAWAVVAT